jgi:DNA-binding HxlR family transcriptional regulator
VNAGRADVAHLVGLIREVLVQVTSVHRLHEDAITMSLFEARVADSEVQGVLVEQHDDTGRLADAMLTIRPYDGLRASIGRPIMALFLASRRWTLRVLWELFEADEPLTFRALKARCADMSSSVLTRRMAELRQARLVIRHSDGYGLSELGKGLVTSMQPLLAWARMWANELESAVDEPAKE